jgi:hypothetical protein
VITRFTRGDGVIGDGLSFSLSPHDSQSRPEGPPIPSHLGSPIPSHLGSPSPSLS